MLLPVALGTLASEKKKATINTGQALTKLLNYCASNPDATIRFPAIDMVLYASSETFYLSEPNTHSREAVFFYLSINTRYPTRAPTPAEPMPPVNRAIHVLSTIITNVMASATEDEMGGQMPIPSGLTSNKWATHSLLIQYKQTMSAPVV